VRESSLGAQAHEEVPFERLVDELKVERDPSRTPLSRSCAFCRNAPEGELRLGDVELEGYELPIETAKFDLFLDMAEVEARCGGPELQHRPLRGLDDGTDGGHLEACSGSSRRAQQPAGRAAAAERERAAAAGRVEPDQS